LHFAARAFGLCAILFAAKTLADPAAEIKRLASLMQWKPGSVVADIGAGDGSYAFAALPYVGDTGKIYLTEIDAKKIAELKNEITKRKLSNVTVEESKEADTNLPPACCDAIFLRRVYHHLTKPVEFDAALVGSLKPGGRLAIIDFPPRAGLPPVADVPSDRGGHGIPQNIVTKELTAAGLQLEQAVTDWPDNSYCLLFVKK
jgi:ubiquinone/menaquinone biosynthesis C-methylase UbiE